jgi:hypothetical protein
MSLQSRIADLITAIGADIKDLKTTPAARAYSTGDTTSVVSGGGVYVVPLNAEDYDSSAMHDNVTNNTRITSTKKGIYLVVGRIAIASAITQDNAFVVQITKNGVTSPPAAAAHIGRGASSALVMIPLQLDVGDYVELRAVNQLTVNMALFAGSGFHFLTSTFVGRY